MSYLFIDFNDYAPNLSPFVIRFIKWVFIHSEFNGINSIGIFHSWILEDPDSYDVTCPKCKTELLIYKVCGEVYLREKATYF